MISIWYLTINLVLKDYVLELTISKIIKYKGNSFVLLGTILSIDEC